MRRPTCRPARAIIALALEAALPAAGDLFAKAPVIHKLDIIADKLPK